jgi:hypothetical protein
VDAEHGRAEHVGPLAPQPRGRRVDAALAQGEAVARRGVRAGLERDAPRHAVAEEGVRTAEGVRVRRADHQLPGAVARPGAAHEGEVEILRLVGAEQGTGERHRDLLRGTACYAT